MKKLILLLIPIISFAQPNQLKLVGGKLSNNVYYNVYVTKQGDTVLIANGSVLFPGPGSGLSLDADGNLNMTGAYVFLGNSTQNFVNGGRSGTISNSSNVISNMNNGECYTSDNTLLQGADSYIKNSHYARMMGDHLKTMYAQSSTNIGYGNFCASPFGATIGYQLSAGDTVTRPENIFMFGYGYNGGYHTDKRGVHLVAGNNVFSVLENGILVINGVKINLTGTPSVGATIVCTGQVGDVYNATWALPTSTRYQTNYFPTEIRQAFAFYNPAGQWLGNQLLILKPINKTQ